MRKPSLWTGVLGAAMALTMVAGPAFAVQETKIGVTSASNLTTTGFPPVSPEHLLKIGVEVVGNERVITTKDGRAQLLFLDHSALTVGPNSNLVLDKFVYDPDAGVGELAFSATKGLFRLVGGRISKNTPVTISTSAGTIGIRGGITIVSIEEGGPVEAIFLFGEEMTVCSGGTASACVTATRPGSLVAMDSEGNVSAPVILTAEQISATVQQLEQPPGEVTDSAVLVFQQAVEDAVLGALEEPAAGLDGTPLPPFFPPEFDPCSGCIEDSGDDKQKTAIETTEPPPPSGGATIFNSTFAGRFKTGSFADLSAGKGTSPDTPTFNVSFSDASIDSGFLTTTTGGLLSLPTSGTPTAAPQGFTGFSFDQSTPNNTPFGSVFGEGFISDDLTFIFYETIDTGCCEDIIFAGIPTTSFPTSGITAYLSEPDFVLGSNVPFVRGISGGDLTVAEPVPFAIDWGFDIDIFGGALVAIDGLGTAQKSAASVFGGTVVTGTSLTADLLGLMRGTTRVFTSEQAHLFDSGIELVRDGDGNAFFGADNPDYFVFQSIGGATDRFGVDEFGELRTEYFPNVVTHVDPTETFGARTTRTLNGFSGGAFQEIQGGDPVGNPILFGNTDGVPGDVNIFTDAATGRVTATFDVTGSTEQQLVAAFGGPGVSAFFDDESFGALESLSIPTKFEGVTVGALLYMVTSDDVLQTSGDFIPTGVGFCQCQFLQWGFWGGDLDLGDGVHVRVHLANWVAGDNIAINLPTVGTATYNGHLIGTVLNGGNVYQAVGGFNMFFDFANSQNTTINVTSFDSADYLANVTSVTNNGIYQVLGADTSNLGRSINFTGAFFGGGTDPVAETGGQFNIAGPVQGPAYSASGIFAGAQ